MKKNPCATVVAIAILCGVNVATAQDMRIYTQIRSKGRVGSEQPSQKSANSPPVFKSLMLFHSGKIYDYILPGEEVTVFEPALQRFTILNKARQIRSELNQEEIRHFLGLAKAEAQRRLASSDGGKSLALLHFQLYPDFTVAYDEAKTQLTLASPNFQYVVKANKPPTPDVVENYLHVADWTAELNSVLHPRSFLPAPRLVLNQELRQRGLVPVTVELKVDTEPEIHLVAEHEWIWNLKEQDRQLIADWEKLLQDSNLRSLPFRQFQQEVLKSESRRR